MFIKFSKLYISFPIFAISADVSESFITITFNVHQTKCSDRNATTEVGFTISRHKREFRMARIQSTVGLANRNIKSKINIAARNKIFHTLLSITYCTRTYNK